MENHAEEEKHIHRKDHFAERFQDYLGEFVYGGIDGSITTFAVVAGAVGANLEASIILILGFANLLADGFSMSVGAYLAAKSETDNYNKHKKIEYWEVDNLPEVEREEIREIYRNKGFSGDLLEQVVDVITADKDRWVDEMMLSELNMMKDDRSPFMIGFATYCSFISIGLIPLSVYVYDLLYGFDGNEFYTTCILTSFAFIFIGWLKSYINESNILKSIAETLALGILAALVSYWVGDFLEHLIMNN